MAGIFNKAPGILVGALALAEPLLDRNCHAVLAILVCLRVQSQALAFCISAGLER